MRKKKERKILDAILKSLFLIWGGNVVLRAHPEEAAPFGGFESVSNEKKKSSLVQNGRVRKKLQVGMFRR